GISFIVLVFGIWAAIQLENYFSKPDLAEIGKVPAFSFTNQDGTTITNETYKGKVYIVEFFFTTCPSICPIMNENMVKIQNEFFGNPNLGIASFSIDPVHDTPSVLKEYANKYKITNTNWHLLTGDKDEIYKLANEGFNLYVGEDSEVEGGFEHSGFFALIDQEGTIRSRKDENENPIIYYNGLEDSGIQMLKEDIKKLL
ncbi:MAG: SCO family protein, partial [Bacteroidetes bacterium]|nr:SCO family protein [Bacteroidota bacterium]